MKRWFTSHPRSIGETYFGHQHAAFGYGVQLLGAGMACLVHGLFPAFFVTTASRTVARMQENMGKRTKGTAVAEPLFATRAVRPTDI